MAPEAVVAGSHDTRSPFLRVWKPRRSPFSTTPQPFFSLPSTQTSFNKQGSRGHAPSPLAPDWNNYEDLERADDPFRDPTENLSDNDRAQETKGVAAVQSFEDPFETDSQRLSVLAQFGELEERFMPGQKRRTPCFIYTLSSRPENPSSAPPSYRTRGD